MEVKVLDLKKGKHKLTITLKPTEMVAYFNKAYNQLAPTVKISGFRAGKAPKKLIEASIGVSKILSEALDMAISENYYKALVENKLNPIAPPKIVINKYPNFGQTEEEIANDFEFEAEIEVLPEVKLEDYSKVKVEKKELKKATSEDVDKVLEHFQKQASTFSEIDRPAEMGDRAEINFEGFLKNVRIDAMCSKNHPVILGEKTLIPGFEEEIVGLKKGEKKDFKIKFPKDYHSKEYAGKEAEFKVELVDLKKIELPKIDDEFAKKFGHKNVENLRKAIEKNLNEEMALDHKRALESEVIDKLLPLLKVEIPDSLIEREAERLIGEFSSQLTSQGLNFQKYLESIKKTHQEIIKDMTPQAEKNVKIGLLLGKIIEEKKLDHHDPKSGEKAIEYLIKELTK